MRCQLQYKEVIDGDDVIGFRDRDECFGDIKRRTIILGKEKFTPVLCDGHYFQFHGFATYNLSHDYLKSLPIFDDKDLRVCIACGYEQHKDDFPNTTMKICYECAYAIQDATEPKRRTNHVRT